MISTKVKIGALDRLLNTMRRPDLRPAWKEARQPLRADIASHRNQQRGPDGSWPARSSSTKVRAQSKRVKRPRPLLGKLPTALQQISDRRRVVMRSRVPWAEVQRSGGTAGHGAKIPARDWLWASKTALDVIASIVTKHLARIWKRG